MKNSFWLKRLLFVILLLAAVFPVAKTVINNFNYYRQPFDLDRARNLYGMSQYVQKDNPSWIADEIVLSYASWYYIQGGSPIIVNSEYPPLGKYLVGSSIYFINSEKIPNIIFGITSLLSLFFLSHLVLKNIFFALIPVGLLAWERLFNEQFIFVPLFETFILTFYLLAIYFFLKGLHKQRYFLLSSLCIGFCWSIKPWMFTIPLLLAWVVFLLFVKHKIRITASWLLSLPLALIVLFLSYFQLIMQGWTLVKIMGVQKWILWYQTNAFSKIGSLWPFVYLNRWYVWWGDNLVLPIAQWTVIWPLFLTFSIGCIGLAVCKYFKINKDFLSKFFARENNIDYINLLCLQLAAYIGFFSFGYMSTRYLFYFMPICYILGTYIIKKMFVKNG